MSTPTTEPEKRPPGILRKILTGCLFGGAGLLIVFILLAIVATVIMSGDETRGSGNPTATPQPTAAPSPTPRPTRIPTPTPTASPSLDAQEALTPAVSAATPRPKPTPQPTWTPRPERRQTPTPAVSSSHRVLIDAVNAANEYIEFVAGQGGDRVSRDDMILACDMYRDLGWDYVVWLQEVKNHIERDDPPPQTFTRRLAFFEGLMAGMEHATGRAQEGCAKMGH